MFLKGNVYLFWFKKRNWNRKVSRRFIFSFYFYMKVFLMIKKFLFVYEVEWFSGDFFDYFFMVDMVDYLVRDLYFDFEIML